MGGWLVREHQKDIIEEIERRSGVKWGNLSPAEQVAWINEVVS